MFELIGEFETNGKKFCTVRVKNSVSVMEKWEYNKMDKIYRNSLKKSIVPTSLYSIPLLSIHSSK